jgi:hypothetical protein
MRHTFAQESLSAKQKIRIAEIRDLEQRAAPGPLALDFGKYRHKNIRPAQSVLTDPGYFYWALANKAWADKWLEFQAWEISQKASHIRPPRTAPDNFRFDLWFDRHGRFIDYEIVHVKAPLKTSPKVLRVKHLDMSLLSNIGPTPSPEYRKLLQKIRDDFLPQGKLKHWDYQAFFDNERNSDLGCREKHCPKIPRLVVTPK